ncbi:NB-ARC domains-containing protein [Tanacetum coccineum]
MKDLDTPSMLQVKELIVLSDGIIFDWVDSPNNIVPTMYCESLDDLSTIMLSKCHNILSLVDSSDRDIDEELGGGNTKKQYFSKLEHLFLQSVTKLHVLWKCPDQYMCLNSLLTLDIYLCMKLERLFSVNAARGLVNLKTLTIFKCSNLKEVIWDGDEDVDIDNVEFPRLVKIELRYLKNLKRFYAGKAIISYTSLVKVVIEGCKIMDKWGDNGTYDTPNLKLVNQCYSSNSPPQFVIGRIAVKKYDAQVMQAVGLKKVPILK